MINILSIFFVKHLLTSPGTHYPGNRYLSTLDQGYLIKSLSLFGGEKSYCAFGSNKRL